MQISVSSGSRDLACRPQLSLRLIEPRLVIGSVDRLAQIYVGTALTAALAFLFFVARVAGLAVGTN
jgi:hypothetical protein